ncbi:MAG: hypothetical protein HW403_27 [Dehalococcoidia bacterium]|nr:hypothetical protein [Dehalococcoidia bacterium]
MAEIYKHIISRVLPGAAVLLLLLAVSSSDHSTAGARPMAVAVGFVKTIGTNTNKTTTTSIAVTVPAAGVAAGNSVIVTFAMDDQTGTVSCADTQLNPYAVDVDIGGGAGTGNVRTVICSAHNVTALVSTNTITVTHPSSAAEAVSAQEFSGLVKKSALDKTASASGTSTTPSSGNTLTTTMANELLVGAIGAEGPVEDTFTAGASYTAGPPTEAGTTGNPAAGNITINPEYRIVSATGTYSADGTITSRDWRAAVATYRNHDWESYNDSGRTAQDDDFASGQNTVYMRGNGYDVAGNYAIGFYDASGTKQCTESIDPAGTLDSSCTFWTGTAGTWRAVTFEPGTSAPALYTSIDTPAEQRTNNVVSDDTFTVQAAAILPEIPSVVASIVVGLSVMATFLWFRRK